MPVPGTLLAESQPFAWHGYLSWAMLGLAFACALAILFDEVVLGHRQHMGIMNLVYPITALYWGPVALWFYLTRGRMHSMKVMERERAERGQSRAEEMMESDAIRWQQVAKGDTHCGAGCTLGDITGEWLVFMLGISWFGPLLGHAFYSEIILDFAFAWTFGVLFQYFTIVPMREGVGPLRGIWQAIKADTLSILAFQMGLFGWMAIFMLVIWPHGIHVDSPDFWFQMQIGMIVGFFTAYPVNRWLLAKGLKEKM